MPRRSSHTVKDYIREAIPVKKIYTVRGEIKPSQLGFCHSHEHLCILRGQSAQENPTLCIDDEACSLAELEAFYAVGGRAVVDAQPVGCGRDPLFLSRISRASGVSIIASTGFHKLQFYPQGHWIFRADEAELTRLYESELQEGIFEACDVAPPARRTSLRAGQIKAALDTSGLTPRYQILFRAAAHACRVTGAPLMVHIEQRADAIALADLLAQEKVPSDQVIFCHMDRAEQALSVHKELCSRGITMEYDTIARPKYHDDKREAALLLEMVQAGFEDQMLLGLDVTRARLKSYGGTPGLCDLRERFIPFLLTQGLSQQQIDKFFVTNPARIWSIGE